MRYQSYRSLEELKAEFQIYYQMNYEMAEIIDYELGEQEETEDGQDTSVEKVTEHLFQNLDNGEYVAVRIFLQRFSYLEPYSEIEGAKAELIQELDSEDGNWMYLLIQEDDGSRISVVIHADYVFGFAYGMYERWM